MVIPTNKNLYIPALFWAIPAICLLFLPVTMLVASAPGYLTLLFKTAATGIGLAVILTTLYRYTSSFGLSVFLALALMTIVGFLPGSWLIFLLTAIICAALELRKGSVHAFRNQGGLMISIIGAILLVFIPYFGLNYSQPFNTIELARQTLHSDTLYHVAIASMIKNYHIISHGMHGLGDLEYHFGSHLLLAALSNITKMSGFDSYGYLFVFLLVPLLCVSVIAVSEEFFPSANLAEFRNKLLMFLLVFLGTGILLPLSVPDIFALWPSFFQSESYTVSLILMLCLMSLLHKQVAPGLSSGIPLIILGPVITGVLLYCTAAKISTGFFSVGLIGAWALLSGEQVFSRLFIGRWLVWLVSAAGFLFLFARINPTMSDSHLEVFGFVRNYVSLPAPLWIKIPFFILVHFFFPLFALLICWQRYRSDNLKGLPGWWILGLIGSLILGAGVIMLLSIQGGSGAYFSNISMFVALPVILSIPKLYAKTVKRHRKILKPLVIASLIIHGVPAIVYGASKFVVEMKANAEQTTLTPYIHQLIRIADTDKESNSLVYIPRTEPYWEKMYSQPLDKNACRLLGFTIPALSEHPGLYSWPTTDCSSFLCGERFHSEGLCEESSLIYSRRELIREAQELGFSRVYLVTANEVEILE
jgi:hypothetical protein